QLRCRAHVRRATSRRAPSIRRRREFSAGSRYRTASLFGRTKNRSSPSILIWLTQSLRTELLRIAFAIAAGGAAFLRNLGLLVRIGGGCRSVSPLQGLQMLERPPSVPRPRAHARPRCSARSPRRGPRAAVKRAHLALNKSELLSIVADIIGVG